MGEPPGPASWFGSGAPAAPQAGPSNPGTEPIPTPVWDTDEERRSDAPAEPHASPPYPVGENATQRFGGPPPYEPGASGGPPPNEPGASGGPPDNAPERFGGPRLGDPGPWGSPPEDAMRHGPPPPGNELGAFGGPPDNATQRLDNSGYGTVTWHQDAPPTPGQKTAPWAPSALPPAGWDPAGPPPAGPPADGPDGTKNRKLPLLIGGIAAAVVLGGGLVYFVSQGSSGPKGGTPAAKSQADVSAQQAAAVDQVLRSGRVARGHLPARLRTCDDVSAGVPGFQQVVRDRQQELSRSKSLAVDRLHNGQNLRRSMIAAYQHSLDADRAYLAWAQDVRARRCGGKIAPLTGHYRQAIAANGKAGPAKRQVVALWRPIANNHGLPTYAWNRL